MSSAPVTLSLPQGPLWMVDDEAELVQGTVAMLARELGSKQVRGTTDPREVAQWIERERPAALITDVRMPHVNGLELVSKLHEKWGPVPVVVMTAYPTAQIDSQAQAGRFAYLPKPFNFRTLRETLAKVCSRPAPSAFSGAIAVSMLDEVVQLYGLAQRTGTLRITATEGQGDIAFDAGRVVDAKTAGARGIDAFNRILCFTSGSFSWLATAPGEVTIQKGLQELLLDAYRLRDEKQAGVQSAASDDDELGELLDSVLPEFTEPKNVPPRPDPTINLTRLERADGFLGAAVFDSVTGESLGAVAREGVDIASAVAGQAEFVRANQRTVQQLGGDDTLEDIIITLHQQYHLLRVSQRKPSLCLFVALDRAEANLAMARHLLSDVERDLVL